VGATQTATRERPTRTEIEPAALDVIQRHGAQIMSTARRYSVTPEDAEDAYQRGLEILLTKAPSTSEDDLVPWLKTVVKHEAFAVRKQRRRQMPVSALSDDDEDPAEPVAPTTTDEEAERYERLRLGAEALGRLKPQEVRALLLKAEGLSYREIQDETGWTYTKVNRCITEGRKAFVDRVRGIESGEECERLAPVLSKLADGEASAADMATLRPHLRGCLACKSKLREYRAAPARAAALFPVVALAGGSAGHGGLLGWLHAHASHAAMRLHTVVESASASKAAAVAGATAALAGGGVAAVHELEPPHHRPHHHHRSHRVVRNAPPVRVTTPERAAARMKSRRRRPTRVEEVHTAAPPAPAPAPGPRPQSAPSPKPAPTRLEGETLGEFAP
jgi:RNA polymerase sigma factor (sigma-70 family)